MHALRDFGAVHSDTDRHWFETSNHLALLEVADEPALVELVDRAWKEQVRFALFREPDRGMEATTVTLEPKAQRICRGLRLALSDQRRTGNTGCGTPGSGTTGG